MAAWPNGTHRDRRKLGPDANLVLRRVLNMECLRPVPVGVVVEIQGEILHRTSAYLICGLVGVPLGDDQGPWLEALMGFAIFCAVFWLLFYLIWIGINWIRWLAGAWLGLSGFSFLIWALRDGDLVLAAAGVINCLIATYFCISPSVYFFAKRQRENRSWLHSGMVVAVFVLLSFTFFIGSVVLFAYRARAEAGAIEFTQEAAIHIYGDQDREWMFANLSPVDVAASTRANLNAFFEQNVGRVSPVLQISTPTAASSSTTPSSRRGSTPYARGSRS